MKTGRRIKFRFSSSGFGTAGGIVIIFTSFFLLLSGFVRGELAALLWGGTLFFVIFFCCLAVFITAVLNRHIQSGFEPSHPLLFQGEEVEPGVLLSGDLFLPLRVRRIPGISLAYKLDFTFKTRKFILLANLHPSRLSFPISGTPLFRGTYSGQDSLVVRDLTGFFQVDIPLGGEGFLTVYPERERDSRLPFLPSLGGSVTPEIRRKRESSDLFDLRKFYPGDDPRKLHWKLYAHSGDLFLRKGEPEPPPSGLFQFVLDLNLDNIPEGMRASVFELLIANMAEILCGILLRGNELLITGRGLVSLAFSAEEEGKLLKFMASLWYGDGEDGLHEDKNAELHNSGGEYVKGVLQGLNKENGAYLYSNPFSSHFDSLLTGLNRMARGNSVRVLTSKIPESARIISRSSLFFHKENEPVNRKPQLTPSPAVFAAWESGIERMAEVAGREILHVL
ncbi:MAG: DUF58 domain-containing protein [Spirochaetales bacterium]|nr:DUF58 domain-containing protein [Spirochaetales bacterium]